MKEGKGSVVKPVVLLVESNLELLDTMVTDLKARYGDHYTVLRSESAVKALAILGELQSGDNPVALILVERQIRQPGAVEFIEQATAYSPEARRVLFTADLENGTIQVSDVARIDYILPGREASAQEYLYPMLDELLIDWHVPFIKRPIGIKVIGYRWSPKSHAIRDFLTRNRISYQWIDVEEDPKVSEVIDLLAADSRNLPLVLLADGTVLKDPPTPEMAERLGLQVHTAQSFYDLIVVGGGPAGLAASVYAATEGLHVVTIECETPGGQASQSALIANYLGFPRGLPGPEFAARAVAQAEHFHAEIVAPLKATGLRVEGDRRIVQLSDGTERGCHAILIAIGVAWRKLDVPEIERLTGSGVYYGGALAEARFCVNDDVYIVGGANSAGQAAVHFARYAHKVILLVRRDSLEKSMSQYLISEIEQTKNIEVLLHTEVKAVHGDRRLEVITIEDTSTGEKRTVRTNWLFIFTGATPQTGWLSGVLQLSEEGYILSARDLMSDGKRPVGWPLGREPYLLETSAPGIFVAGDVRYGSVKRVAAAVGSGAMAVQFIHQYLDTLGHSSQHSPNPE
jgi:thioredoxin reductase (NADPH)